MRDRCLQTLDHDLKMLSPLHQGGVKMSRRRTQGGMKRILVEALILVLASWRGSA